MTKTWITRIGALVAALSLFTASGYAQCGSPAATGGSSNHASYGGGEEAKPEDKDKAKKDKDAKDIVDTAVAAGSFGTLVAAVKAAGLVDTLKGEGPFTVFAPTDEAFAKLPAGTVDDLLKPENKEKLVGILTYHVVAGKVKAEDVVKLSSAKTVNGKEVKITVDGDKVKVDGANVVKTDIVTKNGVIHVIDAVILP